MTGTLATTLIRHLRRMTAPPAAQGYSDGQLLQRFAARGEEMAFAALLQRHGRLVWSVCRRLLDREEDAEDAFQAVFLILARRAATIRKNDSVASWLYGVAYRIAMKAKKKTANRRKHEARVPPRSSERPEAELMCREMQALLDEELHKLPEKYRTPFVLCCLQEKSRKEAADELGWKEGTLAGRLAEARRLLQRRLLRRGVSLAVVLGTAALSEATCSATLMQSTLQAACCYAAGNTPALLISASVAELVQGASQTMLLSKIKIATALLLLASVVGIGIASRRITDPTVSAQPIPQAAAVKQGASGTPKKAEAAIMVRGRVLGADGKPFPGAKVYLWTNAVKTKAEMRVRATTGADGRFRFPIREEERRRQAVVVALAADHGPDWKELANLKKGEEATLRLAKDDVPIQGRILDLEGQPVANATVRVLKLHQMDLDLWLNEVKRGRWLFPANIPEALTLQVTTEKDGRFQLRGLGRERLVYLELSGDKIERVRCWVLTRAKIMHNLPRSGEIYPATFDHIAAPTKPIVGTVREKGTGKPLAGITVQMDVWFNNAKTDEQGRYRIVGSAKQRVYTVYAGGVPYFTTRSRVDDTPGFEPLTVDFELERGIEIRGRVIDKATGKPIKADVEYHSFADNPHLKNVSSLGGVAINERIDGRDKTAADGSFFVVGLPGPGLLTVLADEDDYLKPERPANWKKLVPYVNSAPPLLHAWVPINPSENDPKSTHIDIALEPAKPIDGRVLDADGKPLSNYFVAGLTSSPRMHSYQEEVHQNTSFRVRGVDPGRPRTLVFIHPTKKLGKVQIVREDQRGPLQVRLEPLSSVTGRILNAGGRPYEGLRVRAQVKQDHKDENRMPTLFQLECISESNQLDPQGMTDAEGKFHLDGLIPGLEYMLDVREDKRSDPLQLLGPRNWSAAESGKTKNLGDLKSKR
jgi:RNA polymerase sigma factor (sigma-70 family)